MEKGLTGAVSRPRFTGSYEVEAERLGRDLLQLHYSQIVAKRNVIILFEGWEGAYRKNAFKKLLSILEPCHTRIECVNDVDEKDRKRHWLARFWGDLPERASALLYFHSWYRLLAQRMLEGGLEERELLRAFDEINEFESQQNDHDTVLVKLFFHNDVAGQRRELDKRAAMPWSKQMFGEGPADSLENREAHEAVWERLIEETDYRWAPWTIVNSVDEESAIVEALTAVRDALARAVPMAPPAEQHSAEIHSIAG